PPATPFSPVLRPTRPVAPPMSSRWATRCLPEVSMIDPRVLRRTLCIGAVGAALMVVGAHAQERIAPIPDGIGRATDQMGASVAISGDTAIVGSWLAHVVPYYASGVVDLYRVQDGAWHSEAELTSPSPSADEDFGIAVDVEGDLAVVGSDDTIYT